MPGGTEGIAVRPHRENALWSDRSAVMKRVLALSEAWVLRYGKLAYERASERINITMLSMRHHVEVTHHSDGNPTAELWNLSLPKSAHSQLRARESISLFQKLLRG